MSGFLDSIFSSNTTYTANVQTSTRTKTAGVLGPETWSTTKSVSCIFWHGTIGRGFIGDRFKPEVEGVILVKPSDISTTEIPSTGRIQLMDGATQIGIYKIIYADNIGMQGEVIVVPVKEYK